MYPSISGKEATEAPTLLERTHNYTDWLGTGKTADSFIKIVAKITKFNSLFIVVPKHKQKQNQQGKTKRVERVGS